jgi:hypothetical protein
MSITGRIARILDASQLVLNIGATDGVTEGMAFVIYEPGEEITDPETGDTLGTLEIVKGNLFAAHVQDRITLAKTPSVSRPEAPPSVLSARMAETTGSSAESDSRQELYVQKNQLSGAPKARPVQVGDYVRSIPPSTEDNT